MQNVLKKGSQIRYVGRATNYHQKMLLHPWKKPKIPKEIFRCLLKYHARHIFGKFE